MPLIHTAPSLHLPLFLEETFLHTLDNNSAGVGVGGVLLSGFFYMCPTAKCILYSENVYTAHCTKQRVVK